MQGTQFLYQSHFYTLNRQCEEHKNGNTKNLNLFIFLLNLFSENETWNSNQKVANAENRLL